MAPPALQVSRNLHVIKSGGREGPTARGFFGPTGVKESARHKGVGRALLMVTLKDMASQGYAYTDGAYHAEPFENIEVAPAGGLSTTVTDMANFMIAQLQNGRFGHQRILQEATAQEMHQQHFTNDPRLPGAAAGRCDGAGLKFIAPQRRRDAEKRNLSGSESV